MTTKELISRLLDIAYQVKSTDPEGFRLTMELIADIIRHEAETTQMEKLHREE